jgi:hypothetical protein
MGGGGGKKTGVGNGPGIGQGSDVGDHADENVPGEEDVDRRPELNPTEAAKVVERFNPADARVIQKSETGKALARMDDGLARKLRDGLNPGKGQGGPGSGGGKGSGQGTGEGPGVGPGKATLQQREKRMLRWNMQFTASTGIEYLSQLKGLGAILAFPVTEGAEPRFMIVRDLRPGGKLLDEDVSKIDRIFWFDTKERSVRDIVSVLGIRLPRMPDRFVAFMPKDLEDKLFAMERNHVEKVLRRTFDEDRIEETRFRVVPNGRGKYKPELLSVNMR